MSMQRFLGSMQELGEREVGIVCATDQLARDGHVLEPAGIDLTNYRANPIVLWSHTPEEPVGACTAIAVQNGELAARVQFAPAGVSATADEICALVKGGIVRGVSIGFEPINMVPLDAAKGSRGGCRITSSELLEVSFCAVPVDTGARVVARAFASRPGAVAMLRALPAISAGAIERALAETAARMRERQRPQIMLSAREQFEADRQKSMTVWALQQAEREREKAGQSCGPTGRAGRKVDSDYAERQADLRRLSGERTH